MRPPILGSWNPHLVDGIADLQHASLRLRSLHSKSKSVRHGTRDCVPAGIVSSQRAMHGFRLG
jgi:hypothetical protein